MICCNAAWAEATQQTKEEAETAFNWEVRHFFLIYIFLTVQILEVLSFWKNIIHSGLWQARLQCLFSYFLLYVVYLVPWVFLGFYPGFVCSVSFSFLCLSSYLFTSISLLVPPLDPIVLACWTLTDRKTAPKNCSRLNRYYGWDWNLTAKLMSDQH